MAEADDMTLPQRLRALADHMEGGAKQAILHMPTEEVISTMKMVEDFRHAAEEIDRFDTLIADCIGAEPVREFAEELKGYREKSDRPPTGPGLDWIGEAAKDFEEEAKSQ